MSVMKRNSKTLIIFGCQAYPLFVLCTYYSNLNVCNNLMKLGEINLCILIYRYRNSVFIAQTSRVSRTSRNNASYIGIYIFLRFSKGHVTVINTKIGRKTIFI